MKTLSVMLDCSRNAVPSVEYLKHFIDIISGMGYNELQLYLEDTYEVEGEPYFGYMRGRYNKSEIREIEEYADAHGIELIPSIQTLAHLPKIFRWDRFSGINDTNDILLCDSEETYEFIDKCLASVSEMFKSRKISIGMDEAFMLGMGRHIKEYGYENPTDIFFRHLSRVSELCDKYAFRPMMWSDMFFRTENNGGYYFEEPVIPYGALERKPENVELVYWDYNIRPEGVYRGMIEAHKKMGKLPRWAGASWCWTGFIPNYEYTFEAMKRAVPIMRECGIEDYMITLWGDDGMETPKEANISALYAFAELARGRSFEEIQNGFGEKYGISWENFHTLELPNIIDREKQPVDVYDPSKYMLYCDIFAGIYDSTVDCGVSQKYEEYSKIIASFSQNKDFGYLFDTASKLSKVLSVKYSLGVEIRNAYNEKNTVKMQKIIKKCKLLITYIEEFYAAFKRGWLRENKAFGLEVHTARIGGLIMRVRDCAEILTEWCGNTRVKIDELEEPIIEYGGARASSGKCAVVSNVYSQIFSVNYN